MAKATRLRTRGIWAAGALLATCSLSGCGSSSRDEPGPAPAPAPAPAWERAELRVPPLTFAPTADGFGLNTVVASGDRESLQAFVRRAGDTAWQKLGAAELRGEDIVEWRTSGLAPGTRYDYEVRSESAGVSTTLYAGGVTTAREPGTPFSFAVLTDTHISPRELLPEDPETSDFAEETLLQVGRQIDAIDPDFSINLGDVLDFHLFGFNLPPPDGSWTRLGYLNYRRLFGGGLGNAGQFSVVGNWDGESGCNTEEEIARSREQRLLYLPGPDTDTYPSGASPFEDYYAFTWGDALFVVLNVMTYTPTCHHLSEAGGTTTDWTLGESQLAWLERTLENSSSRWRFLFIHHTVGGAAGDEANSRYGRGGGRAAMVGEQAIVHQLMLDHGVQVFFYGHDHVFTDMLVDGIHYTLPGSAGAPWKFTQAETGYAQSWPDSGYARVDVAPDRLNVEFVSTTGSPLYSYQLP
jgi:hypothetical protein